MKNLAWIALCAVLAICAAGCSRSAQQYIDRGNQGFAAGKYEDAALNYRNALKKEPGSGEAYYRLALTMLKQNKAGDAYQMLIQAVTLSPKNTAAKVQLASLSLTGYVQSPGHPAQLYNRASSLTKELLAANPNSPDGLHLKGEIALIDNHPAEAIEALRAALKGSPDSPDIKIGLAQALIRNNQIPEGEGLAKEIVAQHPQFGAAYGLLYSRYVTQQRWAEAEALLKQQISSNPQDTGPLLRLAGFYFARHQPDQAEKTLSSLLDRRATLPQADLLVGDFHAMTRNWDKALADYQRGASSDKARVNTYLERSAGVLAMLGRREEAVKTLDEVLAKDPKMQTARALKVTILLETGGAKNISAAAALATDLAKDAPGSARIQLIAGQALLANGDQAGAAVHLQQAARAEPRSTTPRLALARLDILRKNYTAALEQADQALTIRPGDGNARLLRVIALTGQGSYSQAKAEADLLAKDTSNARQVEMQLGVIALRQKHYAEAESYFQKMYREGDQDLHPLAGLVSTYVAENLPDRALQLLETEVKRTPGSVGTEALLAATAEAAGKSDLALSELQNMAKQAPNSADLQMRIALLERKQGDLPAALAALQKAKQLAPDNPIVDVGLGGVEDEMGQTAEAIASYRKALAKAPDNVMVLNNLAFLLAETGGDQNEALRLATTALRKAPDNPSMLDTLAWIHTKSGDTASALPVFSRLVSKYPDDAAFRYHYGAALLKSGDRAGAKQQLETALGKKPSPPVKDSIVGLLAKVK
jgi:tetratricopeptide (TPR) repeat protein